MPHPRDQPLPPNHAWSGPFGDLVVLPRAALLERLEQFLPDAGAAQRRAWTEELGVLESEGAKVLQLRPAAAEDGALLEYMLPAEAGRRPDVVVLQNGRVVVVEFKETGRLRRADLDQVAAYARDLSQYHSACEGQDVVPVLVLCGAEARERTIERVLVVPAARLGAKLVELGRTASGDALSVRAFAEGEYAPLPALVQAALLLFENQPLPFIRRAKSAGVHEATERVLALAREARERKVRKLVLLTGVPGAGKTLVGLQVAHGGARELGYVFRRGARGGAPATFLSGNGPLVQVLQDALGSSVFVRDMHRYIREYGLERPDRIPTEHLVVFDEAQRAWDREKMHVSYSKKLPHAQVDFRRSEPDLLVEIADRRDDWALVLALVGEGQEIHSGEEAGMGQWADALAKSGRRWVVHGPERLSPLFARAAFTPEPLLNLDTSLRAQAASDLHRWVSLVLDRGALELAAPLAQRLRRDGFPIYVTRDLEGAKDYVRDRFAAEPQRRFGLVASARAKTLASHVRVVDWGLKKSGFHIGHWFNAGPEDRRSCCALDVAVTEFDCQGLELDLPIVCWGEDFTWNGEQWAMPAAKRAQALVRDPFRLRTNAYRVLLTRGREGLVVFVPPAKAMQGTFEALLRAGALEAERERAAAVG